MDTLELASTDELIGELFSRFDHIVAAGLLERTDEESFLVHRWEGSRFVCAGLGMEVGRKALDSTYEDGEEE